MKLLCKILTITIVIALLLCAYIAYATGTINPTTGEVRDGFGRIMKSPPLWATIFLDSENWKGIAWYLFDVIIFFGGLYIAFLLGSWGFTDKSNYRVKE